jgi:hypothetical protein
MVSNSQHKKTRNITSPITLIDTQPYPIDIFNDLYHSRWPVEEDYKAIKCRMELENFTGKSVFSVYQDFHAKVFAKNNGLDHGLAYQPRPEKEQRKQKTCLPN